MLIRTLPPDDAPEFICILLETDNVVPETNFITRVELDVTPNITLVDVILYAPIKVKELPAALSKTPQVKALLKVIDALSAFMDNLFHVMPVELIVQLPFIDNVAAVAITVPAVYVNTPPAPKQTVLIVIVPLVLIVNWILYVPAVKTDKSSPVPFIIILVLPDKTALAFLIPPPTYITYPFSVFAELNITLPVIVQLSASVHVPPSKNIAPGNVNPALVIVAVLLNCKVPVPANVIPATNVTVVVTVNFILAVKVINPT